MAGSRAASRYAKSLLDLAVEKGALENVQEDMRLLSRVCSQNADLRLMLKSPIIRHEVKKVVLEKLFKNRVNALTLAIIDILTRKNREPLLAEIAMEFQEAYRVFKGIGKASVTSTVALDKNLRQEIEILVKRICEKKTVEIEEHIDPSLITIKIRLTFRPKI
jgi:F-type H+-transporting ATPase subunit delta